MAKKRIKITENDIRRMVSESVRRIVEAYPQSPRRYTLEKDDPFYHELFKTAVEEIERDYEMYCELYKSQVTGESYFRERYPTVEDWIESQGGTRLIHGYMTRYKNALKDNVTQVEFDPDDNLGPEEYDEY